MNASVLLQTTGLLVLSNVFMTFAWYAHLRNLSHRAWWLAALVSWGIALFEYMHAGRRLLHLPRPDGGLAARGAL